MAKRCQVRHRTIRCPGLMRPGIALESTSVGIPDFPGDVPVTVHEGGPGRLVPCLKCSECGFSIYG